MLPTSLAAVVRVAPVLSPMLLLCALVWALPPDLAAQPNRSNPEDEFALELPVFGRMIGSITKIQAPSNGEEYGRELWAVGSVNDDTLQDWVVSRLRCDTLMLRGRFPEEILLYKGVPGGLPAVESGQRIGPSQLGAQTTLMGSGDWDADGHIDLLLKYNIYGDTSFGLHNGGNVNYLTVFWGNSQGNFSLEDTTQLTADSCGWANIEASLSGDFDSDGISDVLVWDPFGTVIFNGRDVRSPEMRMFKGLRNRRWGRDGAPRTASWVWWNVPLAITHMSFTDQDCDGRRDVCMFENDRAAIARVAVLYGRSGLPDTTDVESLTLTIANGHFSLLSDVTGDGTADLVVNTGSPELIRIYAGRPGQRLLEQYRSGYEGPAAGAGHWRRPWAEVLGPSMIHDGWWSTGFQPLYDLGDIHGAAAGNSANEIWTFAKPFLICYTGGLYMDSLIDATFDIRPGNEIGSAVRLGDIDGSGVPTIAVQYDQIPHAGSRAFPGGVAFIKVNELVPWVSGVTRHLPHVPGEACARISGVPSAVARERSFAVDVLPVPSREQVRLMWNPEGLSGDVDITLSDAMGQVALQMETPASAGGAVIPAGKLAPGTFFATLRAGAVTTTVRIVVP